MRDKFNKIVKWQKETFPSATSLSKIHHLEQEVCELKSDLINNNPDRRLEFADCFMLLIGAAENDGLNYDAICDAIEEKLSINKSREWGEPDENGVVNHIINKEK